MVPPPPDAGYEPDGDKQRSVNATASNWVLAALCVLGWLAGQANGTPGAAWLGLAAILMGLVAALHSLLRLYRWVLARRRGVFPVRLCATAAGPGG